MNTASLDLCKEARDRLINDLGDLCHEHYLGCSQNPEAPDGHEYAYDNEVVNLLDTPEAHALINAYVLDTVMEATNSSSKEDESVGLEWAIRQGYRSEIRTHIKQLVGAE